MRTKGTNFLGNSKGVCCEAIQRQEEKSMLSIDDAVRKQVQIHMFARYYTKLLKAEASKEYGHFKMGVPRNHDLRGETFHTQR